MGRRDDKYLRVQFLLSAQMSAFFLVEAKILTVFNGLGSKGSIPVSFPSRIVFRPVKTPALFAMMPKRPKFPTAWLQKLGHLLSNPRPHERSWPCHLA